MTTSNWVIAIEGFETVQVDETDEGWEITICPIGGTASCPLCGQASQTLHSKYVHSVRDLPVGDRAVRLTIEARKFKCRNAACDRKIFCERLTNFVVVRGQRSKRLTVMYRAIAFAVSAESGKRLTKDLKAAISADTLIRIGMCQEV